MRLLENINLFPVKIKLYCIKIKPAITQGNRRLRAITVQVAWAASRTKGSFFMDKFTKLAIRKSRKKALVAVGRKNISDNLAYFERKNAIQSVSCSHL